MMGTGTNATNAGGYSGHFLNRPTLAELLKAPQLGDLQIGIGYIAPVVKEDLYPAMALKPGYGIDGDLLH